MKYQRVLYTNKFTKELQSKLKIQSYNKRRSEKGNVYYVSFLSDADIADAERTSKRLRNVTLKPFQSRYVSDAEHKNQKKTCIEQESSRVSPSSCSLPPNTLNSVTDTNLHTKSQISSLIPIRETLEEHAFRVLGPQIFNPGNCRSMYSFQTTILVSSIPNVNIAESRTF